MSRIVPSREVCFPKVPFHYSKDYPFPCPGIWGRVILTGIKARNYADGIPVSFDCPTCRKQFRRANRRRLE